MKQKKTEVARAKTTTQKLVNLTSLEEKVVRMRRGFTAPHDLVLEQVGQDFPDTRAKLLAIEQQALAAVGVGENATKSKIIRALKSKPKS